MSDPDHAALWSNLQRLLARVEGAADQGTFLDECLDLLVELLGADRGLLVVLHDDGATQVVNARGKGRALEPFEREEMSRTILRRVVESGRSEIVRPVDELGASESMQALSIATAVAAPIRGVAWREGAARGRVRGVVYLDYRDRRRVVGDAQRQFLDAAASIIAAVLEPYERLAVVREDLRALTVKRPLDGPSLDELLGFESLRALRREVASCLAGDAAILIVGESGTGKTQLAHAIAEAGGRKPIVRATLGMSDDLNTITSELFGHEKGAFSGAMTRRTGLVDLADGGTLIFDEILNLPSAAQQILLDFTQFGTFRPLGHDRVEPKRARVRILAATNGDLDAAVADGRFRADLYYRLAAVTLALPPLRARREDIPTIAERVLQQRARGVSMRLGGPLRRLLVSPDLAWPGNVRQLEAVIGRAVDRARLVDPACTTIEPSHVEARDLGVQAVPTQQRPSSSPPAVDPAALGEAWARLGRERGGLDAFERALLTAALDKHGGVAAHAARDLGVGRTSLLSRMDTLGIPRRGRP